MKKILFLLIALFLVSGCEKAEENDKEETKKGELSELKTAMNNLDNYSYEAEITVKTGYLDMTTTMECKEDVKNQTSYCTTSTYGVETEQYIDYAKQMMYSKTTTIYGGSNDWEKTKYNVSSNSYVDLSDYITDVKEEKKDGGTYYTGTINSKKLANAMSQADSSVNSSSIVSDDIDITVFVNSSNYIEKMSFTIVVAGMEEEVEVTFKNFNTSGTITIPASIK